MTYKFLEPLTLANGVTLKNRIVFPPTTLRSSYASGEVADAELDYYALRAGGPGMVIVEMAYVSKAGRSYLGQIGIDDDDKIPGLKRLADVIRHKGSVPVLQLSFGGRIAHPEALPHEDLVAPSAVAGHHLTDVPRELSNAEIEQSIVDFGEATRRAIAAGFAGVELHGANMYLLQQFFSADSNRRTDEWGGDVNGRMRYGLAVLDQVVKVRDAYADDKFIIGFRQSPEEPMTPGIRHQDALLMAQEIAKRPISYFHISLKDAFQPPFMDKADNEPLYAKYKAVLGAIPLIGVGLLRTPEQVEALVQAGVDAAAVGRELIIDPNWVQKVENGDEKGIRYAISPSDFELLKIPSPLIPWLSTRFHNGFVMSTDASYDPQNPWAYYKA
ncbi:MAG: NADH-dependent flavin oxidoreductase [Lactobacillaceae bacterium]|nr:NADH-dependent flavin oxidoreductase [Lactobacillaceae bacterium]